MTEVFDQFLCDVETEESIISTMMDGKVKVRSLWPEHFTHGLRRRIYELLRDGVPYVDLEPTLKAEGIADDETAYVTDLLNCPAIPRKELPEAIATLKRLEALRRLCEAVDRWRAKAPHLEVEAAVKGLRGVLGVFESSLPPKSPPVLIGQGTRGR